VNPIPPGKGVRGETSLTLLVDGGGGAGGGGGAKIVFGGLMCEGESYGIYTESGCSASRN
jgi:hypothetical protein